MSGLRAWWRRRRSLARQRRELAALFRRENRGGVWVIDSPGLPDGFVPPSGSMEPLRPAGGGYVPRETGADLLPPEGGFNRVHSCTTPPERLHAATSRCPVCVRYEATQRSALDAPQPDGAFVVGNFTAWIQHILETHLGEEGRAEAKQDADP